MPCSICNDFVGTPWRRVHRNHIKSGLSWADLESSAQSCYMCDILLRGYWPDAWEEFPPYDRTSPRTDSEAAIATAVTWINDCRSKDHEFCDTPDEATLPSRVVDVGLESGVVRLVQTQGQVAPYIALSHCWGRTHIITTTRGTLPDRLNEISFDQLCNTFRDAVLVTRRLGIRYLWIDSLCIIQDDLADWEIEAAKMMDVYNNSYLTIAATHSFNGDGGLSRDTPDFEVSGTTPDGEPYCLYFRQRIDHHLEGTFDSNFETNFYGKYYGYPSGTHHPLFTRAWVFQERLLSGRVLHFGPYELFYECRTLIECECSAIGNYGSSEAVALPITKQVHSDALGGFAPGVDWHEFAGYYMAQLWRTMVSSYSCLGLTKRSDSLPAMGGLAKHMAQRRKVKYLAGLWENTLNDDLIWSVRNPVKRARPEPRCAPTWSWASVDSFVNYFDEIIYWERQDLELDVGSIPVEEHRPAYEHFARVEDCWAKPAAVDEYGTIKEGQVRVRGLLTCGTLCLKTEADDGGRDITHYFVLPDGSRFPIFTDYLLDGPGANHVPDGSEVWCLRMTQIRRGPEDCLVSLVLRQKDNATQTYERIGTLMIVVSEPPVETVGPIYRSAEEMSVTIV